MSDIKMHIKAEVDKASVSKSVLEVRKSIEKATSGIKLKFESDDFSTATNKLKRQLEKIQIKFSDLIDTNGVDSELKDKFANLSKDINNVGTANIEPKQLEKFKNEMDELQGDILKAKTNLSEMSIKNSLMSQINQLKQELETFKVENADIIDSRKISNDISKISSELNVCIRGAGNLTNESLSNSLENAKNLMSKLAEDAKQKKIELSVEAKTDKAEDKLTNYIRTMQNKLDNLKINNVEALKDTNVKDIASSLKGMMTKALNSIKSKSVEDIDETISHLNFKMKDLMTEINGKNKTINLEINKEKLISEIQEVLQNAQPQALANNGLGEKYNALMGNISNATSTTDIQRCKTELGNLNSELKATTDTSRTFEEALSNAFQRFSAFSIASQAIDTVLNSLKSAVNYVIDLDTEMTQFQYVTGMTKSEADSLRASFSSLGEQIGATTQEVAEGAEMWIRQGKSAQEAMELTSQSVKLAKLAGMESSQATTDLTSALNGYKMESSEASSIVDKLVSVDNSAATSSQDLAEALQATSVSANDAGVSMDKLIGYAGTISEVTQASGSEVGNSLKTIFARMTQVKNAALDDGTTLNDVDKSLQNIGVSLKDSSGNFRSMSDVLDEVAGKWDSLTNVEQNNVATTVAGVRQKEKFLVLFHSQNIS